MKAIIVRGPQGSGKSTFIKSQVNAQELAYVASTGKAIYKRLFYPGNIQAWFAGIHPNDAIAMLYEKPELIQPPYCKKPVWATMPKEIFIETNIPLEQINLCGLLYLGYSIKIHQL